MLLGTLLTKLDDEAVAAEAMLAIGDLVLLAEVERERANHGESMGEYVAGATRRFSNAASDEDWLRVMTAIEKAEDPAASCLSIMVRWSLARDGDERMNGADVPDSPRSCGCGSAAGGCHGGA